MKIIITERQYRQYISLLKESVYDVADDDDDDNDDFLKNYRRGGVVDKEGMVFKTEIGSMPLVLTYSHKNILENGDLEYYCEVVFYGDEFLGVFVTDKRGYLIDVDFPSVISEVGEDIRLQNVLKEMGSKYYYEFEHWLDSEVIPSLHD
jgi:hypothetical protein